MGNRRQAPSEDGVDNTLVDKQNDSPHEKGRKNPSNSNNPRDRQTLPLFREPNANQLYRPTLVHMKCRGVLNISSKKNNLPTCEGIANGLETVREYPPMQPKAALHSFAHTMNVHLDDHNVLPGFGDKPTSNRGQMKKGNEQAKEQVNLPIIVDDKWDDMKSSIQEESSFDLNKFGSIKSDMKMYGTSSAYLLVLRPYADFNHTVSPQQNDSTPDEKKHPKDADHTHTPDVEHGKTGHLHTEDLPIPNKSIIYAVNPVNEFGLTKRRVNVKNDGHAMTCTSSTVKVGILEIHMASIGQEDVMDEKDNSNVSTSRSRHGTNRAHGVEEDEGGEEKLLGASQEETTVFPIPGPTNAVTFPSFQETKEIFTKFSDASKKVHNSMTFNAKFLKNELENDFLRRTWAASEKVMLNCEKNVVRMKKTLVDAYKFLSDLSRD